MQFSFRFYFIRMIKRHMLSHNGTPIKDQAIESRKYLNLMTIFKLCIFSQYVLQPKWQTFQQRLQSTKWKYVRRMETFQH